MQQQLKNLKRKPVQCVKIKEIFNVKSAKLFHFVQSIVRKLIHHNINRYVISLHLQKDLNIFQECLQKHGIRKNLRFNLYYMIQQVNIKEWICLMIYLFTIENISKSIQYKNIMIIFQKNIVMTYICLLKDKILLNLQKVIKKEFIVMIL